MVNTRTSIYASTPLVTIAFTLAHAPVWATGTSTSAPEVDQLVDVATTLTVWASFMPLVSTKRVRGEDQ